MYNLLLAGLRAYLFQGKEGNLLIFVSSTLHFRPKYLLTKDAETENRFHRPIVTRRLRGLPRSPPEKENQSGQAENIQ